MLAVKAAVATPDALVGKVIVLVPLLNVPDTPLDGAVKTTFVPGMPLPDSVVKVTASAMAKGEFSLADCGVLPAFAVNAAGAVADKP